MPSFFLGAKSQLLVCPGISAGLREGLSCLSWLKATHSTEDAGPKLPEFPQPPRGYSNVTIGLKGPDAAGALLMGHVLKRDCKAARAEGSGGQLALPLRGTLHALVLALWGLQLPSGHIDLLWRGLSHGLRCIKKRFLVAGRPPPLSPPPAPPSLPPAPPSPPLVPAGPPKL